MERIIHRANGGNYPENTLEAIEWAVRADADAIEIDVMLSADEVPVLSHDNRLGRMTLSRKKVGELTVSELKNLTGRSDDLKKKGTFATLPEAIQIVKGKKKLFIELKGGSDNKILSESVLNALNGTLSSDSFIISSFDEKLLQLVKAKRKGIKTAYIFSNPLSYFSIDKIDQRNGGFEQWHCGKWMIRFNMAERANSERKRLYPWLVNTEYEMKLCISKGVEGIITDEIELLNEVLSE